MDAEMITLINGLRGAQAVIILVYLAARRAMTLKDLQLWTGLSDDYLRPALKSLVGKNQLFEQKGEHGRTVWLVTGETLFMSQNPLLADSGSTTTTTEEKICSENHVVVVADTQNPLLADSGCDRQYQTFGVTFEANLKKCRREGIGEPAASIISELAWVSPEYIEAHIRSLRPGDSKGLAILRMKSDEMPQIWVDEIAKLPDGISERAEMRLEAIKAGRKERGSRRGKRKSVRKEGHDPAEVCPDKNREVSPDRYRI